MVLNHLKLYCAYLEEQKFFYTRKFNFELLEESDKEITLKFGSSLVTFSENRMQNAYYHFAFNIPFEMVEEAKAWTGSRVDIMKYEKKEIHEFEKWKARAFYFLDPAGNIVEFIGRENLVFDQEKDLPGKEFSEQNILHLSEVGLPVFQVSSAFKMLNEKTGIEAFDCEGNTFCACGDDRGLFIIVDKAEKTWFPSDERAKGYPLEVEFEQGGKTYSLVAESGDVRITGDGEQQTTGS